MATQHSNGGLAEGARGPCRAEDAAAGSTVPGGRPGGGGGAGAATALRAQHSAGAVGRGGGWVPRPRRPRRLFPRPPLLHAGRLPPSQGAVPPPPPPSLSPPAPPLRTPAPLSLPPTPAPTQFSCSATKTARYEQHRRNCFALGNCFAPQKWFTGGCTATATCGAVHPSALTPDAIQALLAPLLPAQAARCPIAFVAALQAELHCCRPLHAPPCCEPNCFVTPPCTTNSALLFDTSVVRANGVFSSPPPSSYPHAQCLSM